MGIEQYCNYDHREPIIKLWGREKNNHFSPETGEKTHKYSQIARNLRYEDLIIS